MKLIWYISAIFVIFSILLNNPQKSNIGNFGNNTQFLTPTRSTQKGLQLLISLNIFIFFVLTIFLVVNSKVYY